MIVTKLPSSSECGEQPVLYGSEQTWASNFKREFHHKDNIKFCGDTLLVKHLETCLMMQYGT